METIKVRRGVNLHFGEGEREKKNGFIRQTFPTGRLGPDREPVHKATMLSCLLEENPQRPQLPSSASQADAVGLMPLSIKRPPPPS